MPQLGISNQLRLVNVLKREQKSPEFLSVNPLCLVPYLITPHGTGIGESNAMLWQLRKDGTLMADTCSNDILLWQRHARPSLMYWDAHLKGNRSMLSQDYSMIDIAVFGYTHVLRKAGLSLKSVPNLARWIDAVMETDSFVPLSQLGSTVLSDVA